MCLCVCVCVCVAVCIQLPMRMRRIISSVACLAIPYFSKLSHKRQDFRKIKSYRKQGVSFDFPLQIWSETLIILMRI